MRTQLHHLVTAAPWADAPALTCQRTTVTYAQLGQLVARVAAGLRRLGLAKGDRVGVYLDKRIETVAAMFGTSAAGGVVVPINPLLRARQVGHILADCRPHVLVTTPARAALLAEQLATSGAVRHLVVVDPETGAGPDQTRTVDWESFTRAEPAAVESGSAGTAAVDSVGIDTDPAAIFYTSGSTGQPKGVVVSHRNLLVGAESVATYLENSSDDVILAALPLSFDAGFSQLTTGFHAGAHVVLVNYLVPGDVVRHCAEHGVTGLTAVPPLWIQLADQPWPPEATRRLRYFANTGGRMPKTVLDKLRTIFPAAKPFLMYGLTEAFRSTYLDPSQVDARPDSIGKAIPNAEVLVVRADGSLCDPGEPGELVHRGALVSLGYWNDPVRTAERFRPAPGRDPHLCTTELAVWSGDTVVRDNEGFLYFVGRDDEMVKTSGYRVSPTEIEEVAYASGPVRDAVALGVDDDRLGQHIVLVVAPTAGERLDPDLLHRRLRKQLPLYMVPKQIVVREYLPRSPNGKFDRQRIRQELAT